MDRRIVLTGLGATALAAGGIALAPGRRAPLIGAANAQDAGGEEIAEMVIGSPDAPVELIEYASYTCPHCARFHSDVLPALKEAYMDTGQVRYVYREVYFDRFGLWASMVARCGGPNRFFGITDILYENQREWVQGDPATVAENLRRIGLSAGLARDELEACMTDGAFAQALVTRYEGFMEEHEIEGTPSFVIDGELYGNMGFNQFQTILDERIAAAGEG